MKTISLIGWLMLEYVRFDVGWGYCVWMVDESEVHIGVDRFLL